MTSAFCPGHITCFFQPVRTADVLTTGSRGVGIRLSKGTKVTLEERSDDSLKMVMDGKEGDYAVTRDAVRRISGRGFDIIIENDLPVSQGFGMSASGSIAAALCACEFECKDHSEAFVAAHISEVMNGGGLGDVSAISCPSHVPVRKVAGIPPLGQVIDSGLELKDLRVAVLGEPMKTGNILSDPGTNRRLMESGSRSVDSFIADPSVDALFSLSREFSRYVGLETQIMSSRIDSLPRSGMCMLGHSIFTLDDDGDSIPCPSTDRMPFICKA